MSLKLTLISLPKHHPAPGWTRNLEKSVHNTGSWVASSPIIIQHRNGFTHQTSTKRLPYAADKERNKPRSLLSRNSGLAEVNEDSWLQDTKVSIAVEAYTVWNFGLQLICRLGVRSKARKPSQHWPEQKGVDLSQITRSEVSSPGLKRGLRDAISLFYLSLYHP